MDFAAVASADAVEAQLADSKEPNWFSSVSLALSISPTPTAISAMYQTSDSMSPECVTWFSSVQSRVLAPACLRGRVLMLFVPSGRHDHACSGRRRGRPHRAASWLP